MESGVLCSCSAGTVEFVCLLAERVNRDSSAPSNIRGLTKSKLTGSPCLHHYLLSETTSSRRVFCPRTRLGGTHIFLHARTQPKPIAGSSRHNFRACSP